MSGYGWGNPYEGSYGGGYHHHHHHHQHPPPPGGYPEGYSPHLNPYAPDWHPANQGYGWYHWERPSHCNGEFHWVRCEGGHIPPGAVHAGRDLDGGPLYAGRAYYEGDLLPAKVAPFLHHAYVSYSGHERTVHQYEVLVSHHTAWAEDCHGRVPPEAIVVGQTADGENLYMGRAMHHGTLTPGKVHPSNGCLYIPFGGHEHSYENYEVLILT